MKKYTAAFLVFIIIVAGFILLYTLNLEANDRQLTWLIWIYFSVLTYLFHYGIVRTTQSRPQVFIRYYIAATTFKLLLHLGVIIIYSLFHRAEAVRFIFTFMVMYLLFTAFEVLSVWKNAEAKGEKFKN